MENSKKSVLLLVAMILGVCFVVFMGIGTYNDIRLSTYEGFVAALERGGQNMIDKETFEALGLSPLGSTSQKLELAVFIISIPALILNIFGWLKSKAKIALIAAILYLVSLNIPSAVLCFIGYSKLKKAA